ncbi:dTDP-4-dehydrorhamnose 3,5-epimerase [Geotalea uraniireducens]|uniref:dTDP-4-dehydrorhamnose 3,5-epimerase n=1 Tax=Geotalea uraniireducens TaxID=351604 RepID=A0ABN6VSG8_9BACT|nr:dTDP-4-dehydrorhamnose 3,5-epimerase [Geotalea uraniireducens]BDV43034.1 dTDP-4-dehydrorhamnose 3,5-epimerase [Geotalea uraniireducens]
MIFTPLELANAFLIEPERLEDQRGFFARSFCREEFASRGLNPEIAQCNISYNASKGTLRGMHYQHPRGEDKVVRCTRGAIFDVIIDLRPDSATFKQHFGVLLTEMNRRMLYVPVGFAHGFQTLEDHTEVFYQMSEFYVPENGRGVRWDDPAFGIHWPEVVTIISERDATYPDFSL